MKKLFKNKKGFTLVELMVVVAIIGILTAIAIPVYNSVTSKADQRTCDANVRILKAAVENYHVDNGKYPEKPEDLDTYIEGKYASVKCPSTKAAYTYTKPDDGKTDFKIVCTAGNNKKAHTFRELDNSASK
ncbi:MAG: prepilin-type N-terminal cleavage/methylation domain-containing protein [Oscillospiraceae bacterium]